MTRKPESMGIFGFSWQEKTGDFMRKHMKGTALAKKLSDFWQAGGVNTKLIENIQRTYAAEMALGRQPVSWVVPPNSAGDGGTFSSDTISLAGIVSGKTNIDAALVLEYFRALWVLARDGKIDSAKWDPKGYKSTTALQKTFSTEKSVADIASSSIKTIVILVGLGLGAYALSIAAPFLKRKGQ